MSRSEERYVTRSYLDENKNKVWAVHDLMNPASCGWRVEFTTDYPDVADSLVLVLNSIHNNKIAADGVCDCVDWKVGCTKIWPTSPCRRRLEGLDKASYTAEEISVALQFLTNQKKSGFEAAIDNHIDGQGVIQKAKDAMEFYDKVCNASDEDKVAVGTDHIESVISTLRCISTGSI